MGGLPAFQVSIERRAEEEFVKLPAHVMERFRGVFELLEEDPYRPRPGCDIRVIQGHPRMRAVRLGDYRGIYEVVEEERTVWFTKFGHRRSIYR